MRKKGELPDRVYLVIESAVDEIADILIEGKDDVELTKSADKLVVTWLERLVIGKETLK